jgi:hypothetical protein
MLRFLWKCVLEVLPPTCATVVAGILLSAYHDHIVALQNVIDPRASLEQAAALASDGGKQPQAVIAPEVRSERAADPAPSGDKSPAAGAHVNSQTPAPEGDRADGVASETKTPEDSDTKSDAKTAPAAATDTQAAQLNAVLMASSPMSQPPAEIKAAQPVETKASEGTAATSEGPVAEGPSVAPDEPAQAVPATDPGPATAKAAAAKSPDSPAVSPVVRPRFSRHPAKPARKVTVVERLPPPVVAMVPLPPPAAPPMVAMEAPLQVSPGRSTLPSHAQPTPPLAPGAPQAIGPTLPPSGPNPVVASAAAAPTGAPSSPGAPPGGVNASQEGVAKPSEPTRVFGVPIPPSIAAVGGVLDPRPVLSAGQKAFEKIVMTAKSVVPDFGHEQ